MNDKHDRAFGWHNLINHVLYLECVEDCKALCLRSSTSCSPIHSE